MFKTIANHRILHSKQPTVALYRNLSLFNLDAYNANSFLNGLSSSVARMNKVIKDAMISVVII